MTTTHRPTAPADSGRLATAKRLLAAPVDISMLVYFRVAFGSIMVWEMWRFIDRGWIDRYYTDKELFFSYWPFTFVEPLPEPWIHLVFWATMAAAACVATGAFFRVAAPAMFTGLAYIFLLERARYLNHFYLIVLIAFLMCFLPMHRSLSFDVQRDPSIRSETAPAWTLWLLRFQIGVPYFFGGIAKLNHDWLRGEPLRDWLSARTDFPLLGRFFTDEPVVWAMTYGALCLDLFVVAGLLYRRTRPWAFLAAVTFHLMNSRLFDIGVFPWVMMSATAVFFDPAAPRRVVTELQRQRPLANRRVGALLAGAAVGWVVGGFLPTSFSPWRAVIAAVTVGIGGYHLAAVRHPVPEPTPRKRGKRRAGKRQPPPVVSRPVFVLLASWVAIQVAVPLRHFAVPGNVHWTEEGHDFSWHMKLRDKDADADFYVIADGEVFEVDHDDYLTSRQESKMEARPHLMVQYADFLQQEYESLGYRNVEVYADAWASLNGRDAQQLIDPRFDLTSASIPWIGHEEWILPLADD